MQCALDFPKIALDDSPAFYSFQGSRITVYGTIYKKTILLVDKDRTLNDRS